jgi:5-methylcytosine-specific restriction endonuclease McrA
VPPRRLCAEPGCKRRVFKDRCSEHAARYQAVRDQRPEHLIHLSPADRRMRAQLLANAAYTCHWCGRTATQLDFAIPLALCGPATYDNAVAACKPCNARRGGLVHR